MVGAVLRFLGCVLYPRFRFGFGFGFGLGSVGAVFPRQRLFGARWYREGWKRWSVKRTLVLFNVITNLMTTIFTILVPVQCTSFTSL